jgi:hypothetical protein
MGMLEVTVLVPAERLAEFHSLYARWLDNSAGRGDESVSQNIERHRWTGDERDLATWLLPKLAPKARAFFELLWATPGRAFSTEEVMRSLGLESDRQVAGTLAWTGRYCASRGYWSPILWDERLGYRMDPTVATLLKGVAEELRALRGSGRE